MKDAQLEEDWLVQFLNSIFLPPETVNKWINWLSIELTQFYTTPVHHLLLYKRKMSNSKTREARQNFRDGLRNIHSIRPRNGVLRFFPSQPTSEKLHLVLGKTVDHQQNSVFQRALPQHIHTQCLWWFRCFWTEPEQDIEVSNKIN